jgi:hypothetical protein
VATLGAATAAALLGLGSLLLWTLIGTGAHWPPKLAAIVLTPGVAFMVWQESRPVTGWPTDGKPPADAVFVSASVEEPSRRTKGAIYLWVTAPGEQKPRAYQLPYSRPLHEQMHAALERTKRGERLGVRRQGEDSSTRSRTSSPFRVYRLPPPAAGPKRTE